MDMSTLTSSSGVVCVKLLCEIASEKVDLSHWGTSETTQTLAHLRTGQRSDNDDNDAPASPPAALDSRCDERKGCVITCESERQREEK
jgi:hypothetical protein